MPIYPQIPLHEQNQKDMLRGSLKLGGSRTPSHFDDVDADVRLSFRLTILANEDMDSAKGALYPYSIEPASGPKPSSSILSSPG